MDDAPLLELEGFAGPLDNLLALARAHEIDLTRLSLDALVDQLAASLRQAKPPTPVGRKADWVVMTAWLLQLRSRLLLPLGPHEDEPAQQAAERYDRLADPQAMRVLARWLDARPQLGRDVFALGQAADLGSLDGDEPRADVVAFLWASLALFDDDGDATDAIGAYRPGRPTPYSIPAACARIRLLLATASEGGRLERFLPVMPQASSPVQECEQRRSAWSSTFAAGLELAREGSAALMQEGLFTPIHVKSSEPRQSAR